MSSDSWPAGPRCLGATGSCHVWVRARLPRHRLWRQHRSDRHRNARSASNSPFRRRLELLASPIDRGRCLLRPLERMWINGEAAASGARGPCRHTGLDSGSWKRDPAASLPSRRWPWSCSSPLVARPVRQPAARRPARRRSSQARPKRPRYAPTVRAHRRAPRRHPDRYRMGPHLGRRPSRVPEVPGIGRRG